MVANWACEPQRKALDAVEIRFVDEEKVKDLGIVVDARQSGTGPDKTFGKMHRGVHVRTNVEAIRLAGEMVLTAPISMTPERSSNSWQLVQKGHFEIKNIKPPMLAKLAEVGAFRMKGVISCTSPGREDGRTDERGGRSVG